MIAFTESGKAVVVTQTPHSTEIKRRIMQYLADGETIDSVAHLMDYSPNTIKTYMHQLYTELKVHSMAHAVAIMMRNGWIT